MVPYLKNVALCMLVCFCSADGPFTGVPEGISTCECGIFDNLHHGGLGCLNSQVSFGNIAYVAIVITTSSILHMPIVEHRYSPDFYDPVEKGGRSAGRPLFGHLLSKGSQFVVLLGSIISTFALVIGTEFSCCILSVGISRRRIMRKH